MATTILLKRGTKAAVLNKYPTGWNLSEPIFCTDTGELLVGLGVGKNLKDINGQPVLDDNGNMIYYAVYGVGMSGLGSGITILDNDLELPTVDVAVDGAVYVLKADSEANGSSSMVMFSKADGVYKRVSGGGTGSGTTRFTASTGGLQFVGNGTNFVDIKIINNKADGLVKLDSSGKMSADFLRDGVTNKAFTAVQANKLTALETSMTNKADKVHTHRAYEIEETSNLHFVNDSEKTSLSGINFNIREKINSMTFGIAWKGQVNTYAHLASTYSSPEAGWAVFVAADETKGGGRSLYVYSASEGKWNFQGSFDTVPDATGAAKGVIRLTGDLAGTAESPTLAPINGLIPGEYQMATVTVDAKGRVISIEEPTAKVAVIEDGLYSATGTFSSNFIDQLLAAKANLNHTHEGFHDSHLVGSIMVDETEMGDNKILVYVTDENGKGKLVYSDMSISSLIDDSNNPASPAEAYTDRTYSQNKIENKMAGKANIVHAHPEFLKTSEATSLLSAKAEYFDQDVLHEPNQLGTMRVDESNKGDGRVMIFDGSSNTVKFADAAASGEIKDNIVGVNTTFSSDKVNQELMKKADKVHEHAEYVKKTDMPTNLQGYVKTGEVESKIQNAISTINFSPYAKTDDLAAVYATKSDLITKQDAGKISDMPVDTFSRQDGRVLAYDALNNKLVFKAAATGGTGGGSEIDDSPENVATPMTTRVFSSAKTKELINNAGAAKLDKTAIDDTSAAVNKVYSSTKMAADIGIINTNITNINTAIAGKSDKTYVDTQVTNLTNKVYLKTVVDSIMDTKSNVGHQHPNDHKPDVLGSKTVDETTIANNKVLAYNEIEDKLSYINVNTISGDYSIVGGHNVSVEVDEETKEIKLTTIIEDWKPNTFYRVKDFIFVGGIIYRALMEHVSSVAFSIDMATGQAKWESVAGGGSGSGADLNQVTKLGVVATTAAPKIIELTIPESVDLKRQAVEVLKFVPGTTNVIQTICQFDNADATSFVCDGIPANEHPNLIFDGTMRLRTQYDIAMTNGGVLGTGNLWTATIDRTQFKTIESIQVI